MILENLYHGSVRDFEHFSPEFVGTGDGALTFGWGIYLTDNIKVARMFRKRGSGKLFHVEKPAYPRMVNVMRG